MEKYESFIEEHTAKELESILNEQIDNGELDTGDICRLKRKIFSGKHPLRIIGIYSAICTFAGGLFAYMHNLPGERIINNAEDGLILGAIGGVFAAYMLSRCYKKSFDKVKEGCRKYLNK